MKRSKKWFIACLTLFALVAPYLLTSSDASALSYAYNAFPVLNKWYVAEDNGAFNEASLKSGTFSSTFLASDSSISGNFTQPEGEYTWKQYAYDQCPNGSPHNIFYSLFDQNNRWSLSGTSFTNIGWRYYQMFDYTLSEQQLCTNTGSYDYDSIYAADINLSNGVPTKLVSLSSIVANRQSSTVEPMQRGTLSSITVPMGFSQDNVGTIPANTPLKWEFSLASTNEIDNIASNPYISFNIKYMAADPSTFSGTTSDFNNTFTEVVLPASSCSFNNNYRVTYENNDESGNLSGVQVTCSYTPSTPMSYVSATLILSGNESQSIPLLSYDYGSLVFGGNYLITNNDRTWSGILANDQPTGDNIHKAPGWTQLYGEELQPGSSDCNPNDWSCQLQNLFSFDLLNPFRPLFNLFMDQNTCQQIPIIAGMIHSQETQVCPWFAASTRNIVTPVLGIASIMLLFGFIVRWLGARSGNFFEDTTDGHDVGSVHVGRRNKK